MSLLDKPVDKLTEADLKALIDEQVAEAKTLDYKLMGYGNSDDNKREFLRDVTSFANTVGGYIIIGINEDNGKASALPGITVTSADEEIQRLENVLRDGVKPRIPRVEFGPVPLENGNLAIVIRIPQSWAAPHMITFKGLSQFWARNSKGKYQLDVDEIRAAFRISEGLADAIKNFRADRLAKIVADETPIKITYPPRIVLHVVPLSSLALNSPKFGAATLWNDSWSQLRPIGTAGSSLRVNFDGLLVWSVPAYVQVFRNGIIESVTCAPFKLRGQPLGSEPGILTSEQFEEDIIESLPGYFAYLKRLSVEPPYILTMSLHGVLGYELSTDNPNFFLQSMDPHNIDRNNLIIPEIMLESVDNINVATIMKPMFDSIWNAASWPSSLNYDKEGKWVGWTRRR